MWVGEPEGSDYIHKASNHGHIWLVLRTPIFFTLVVDETHPENHFVLHLFAFVFEVDQNDENRSCNVRSGLDKVLFDVVTSTCQIVKHDSSELTAPKVGRNHTQFVLVNFPHIPCNSSESLLEPLRL